ncbi:unnamed protein product [Spirodela intermedia]|uniref:Uncharacterized protein n=1 Tax=Spirodela intermedia TaxID=51605 RepID=A0A7I8I809_SPIIN|nr:unnamed protein product [Spirodela intermedia]CAA6653719.1 unnamed protein product [Spirodela intermedia]
MFKSSSALPRPQLPDAPFPLRLKRYCGGRAGNLSNSPTNLGFYMAQLHFLLLIFNYPFSSSMSVFHSYPGLRAFETKPKGSKVYQAFVSEGLDRFPEWEKLRKYQRKNGSILDSPFATTAALTHHWDVKCLEYYILSFRSLGMQWLKNDEEITSSMTIYAMAFRLLRMHGYGVLSGSMDQIDEEHFSNSLDGNLEDSNVVLELYKTRKFLTKELSKYGKDERLIEVDHALKIHVFSHLPRLEHRRNITQFNVDRFQTLEMSHVLHHIDAKELLAFVIEEFNGYQSSYRKELEHLQRWAKENRLDQPNLLNCCSEQVKIIYSTLHATINEIGAKASWHDLLWSFMKEAEWVVEKVVPTIEQYLVLPPDILGDPEYHKLYQLLSTCGRPLNDIQGSKLKDKEVKLNNVSLLVFEGGGSLSMDGAKEELRSLVERNREDIVPRACKDILWNMSGTLHLFYLDNDEFSSPTIQITGAMNSLIHDPIELVHCSGNARRERGGP